MNGMERVGLVIAAILTLAVYTVLYRENPIYRLAEHIFIGLSVGFGVVIIWEQVLLPKWWVPFVKEGRWYLVIPALFGLLWYFQLTPRYIWLSRIVIGITLGAGAGLTFQGIMGLYWKQVLAAFRPLYTPGNWLRTFNDWVFIITTLTVMIYFFFSIPHRRPAIRVPATVGRWLLMIAFGALFGSTVMARLSLFIERLKFLFYEFPKALH